MLRTYHLSHQINILTEFSFLAVSTGNNIENGGIEMIPRPTFYIYSRKKTYCTDINVFPEVSSKEIMLTFSEFTVFMSPQNIATTIPKHSALLYLQCYVK